MALLIAYLLAFVLPGLLLGRLLGIRGPGTAIALSYVVLIVLSSAVRLADGSVAVLSAALAVTIGVLGTIEWRRALRTSGSLSVLADATVAAVVRIGRSGVATWAPLGTLFVILLYLLWAGPYMEIPADAWWHAGRIQQQLQNMESGVLPAAEQGGLLALLKAQDVWYVLAAYLAHLSGTGMAQSLLPLTVATTLSFLAAVYRFGLEIFRRQGLTEPLAHGVAAASVAFFLLHFGVSVFSFVRYYALAPAMLNFTLYFAAVSLFSGFLHSERGGYGKLVLVAVVLAAMTLIHTQEAMLAAVMLLLILLVHAVRCRHALVGLLAGRMPAEQAGTTGANVRRVVVLSAAAVLVGAGVHIASYMLLRRNGIHNIFLMPLQDILPFVRHMYILKPYFQFYQVLTLWGVAVYVLFALRFRAFRDNPYVIAGMLSPLLTVFNPVFTDLFLRYSWPEVLWRLCYVIPLPFVGGYFLVRGLSWLRRGPASRRIAGAAATAALVGLLWPVHARYVEAPFSRLYTVVPVSRQHDHRKWADLYEFLNAQPPGGLVTDAVTGYTVNALTAHRYPGYKFHGTDRIDLKRQVYGAGDFRAFDGWLLVVNTRNGTPSRTGALSRHWPRDVLTVSRGYSPAFERFVGANPEMFVKMWENNGISVYRIRARAS
jgi:hypothetical protein